MGILCVSRELKQMEGQFERTSSKSPFLEIWMLHGLFRRHGPALRQSW